MGEFGAGQRAYDMVLTALKVISVHVSRCELSADHIIQNGYRHIDTASGYRECLLPVLRLL
jgi:diketogulonate reductase-like aldo/keto reductase